MRLTLHTDYALRTLIYLGLSEPRHATIAEISRAYGISENHLVKVVHRLGQLGFVKTSRGRGGGLRLARPAEDIIVGQVVRQTEEDLALVACFANGICAITPACRLRGVLGEALAAFLAVLIAIAWPIFCMAAKGWQQQSCWAWSLRQYKHDMFLRS